MTLLGINQINVHSYEKRNNASVLSEIGRCVMLTVIPQLALVDDTAFALPSDVGNPYTSNPKPTMLSGVI